MGTSDALCVYCRRLPVDPVCRPFCGDRCRLADLGQWLTGAYSVPAEDLPEEPDPGQDGEAS